MADDKQYQIVRHNTAPYEIDPVTVTEERERVELTHELNIRRQQFDYRGVPIVRGTVWIENLIEKSNLSLNSNEPNTETEWSEFVRIDESNRIQISEISTPSLSRNTQTVIDTYATEFLLTEDLMVIEGANSLGMFDHFSGLNPSLAHFDLQRLIEDNLDASSIFSLDLEYNDTSNIETASFSGNIENSGDVMRKLNQGANILRVGLETGENRAAFKFTVTPSGKIEILQPVNPSFDKILEVVSESLWDYLAT